GLAVHLDRDDRAGRGELGDREAVVVAALDHADAIEAVEGEVGRLADAAAGVQDRLQGRPAPARLPAEAGRAHDVVAVAGALLDADPILAGERAELVQGEDPRAGDAGHLEAPGLRIDRRVDVAIAAEVAGDRRDHRAQA